MSEPIPSPFISTPEEAAEATARLEELSLGIPDEVSTAQKKIITTVFSLEGIPYDLSHLRAMQQGIRFAANMLDSKEYARLTPVILSLFRLIKESRDTHEKGTAAKV